MATFLECRDCARNPRVILTDQWTGSAIFLLKNQDTGLYSLEGSLPLPKGVRAVSGTVQIEVFNLAAGPAWPTETYTADDVSTTLVLETAGTTAVVGAIASYGGNGKFEFNITVPAAPTGGFTAVNDGAKFYVRFTGTDNVEYRYFVGRAVNEDPCFTTVFEVPCALSGAQAYVCPIDFCGGDNAGIYIDGESIGSFLESGRLVVDNNAFPTVVGSYSSTDNLVTLFLGNPGIACTSSIEYRNGSETVILNPSTLRCTYSYDITGVDVTNPITLNSLIVNGIDRFGTRAAIVAVAGTLDVQGADLATKLNDLGIGTWSYTAATDVLAVSTTSTLGVLGGLNGAATPVAIALSPAISGCV